MGCGPYLVDVHAVHGLVHALHDGGHVACYLTHRHRGLDAATDGVDAAREPEQVERLALLPDGVLRVYARAVCVALLQCLSI